MDTLDKGNQDTVWIEDHQLPRSPGFGSHRRIGRQQSPGLILLVERFKSGHLDAARTLFGQRPLRGEPQVEFHAISCDNRILSLLMQDLEAPLPLEAGRPTEIGGGQNRDRTGESHPALLW